MKRLIFLLFTAFCSCFISKAQKNLEVLAYDWGGPFFENSRFENRDTSAVHILQSNSIVEYAYDEKGVLNRYFLLHEKVKINNQAGLEQYRTLRVGGDVLSMKARFIGKNGRIIELDQSDVKTLEDGNGKSQNLVFRRARVGGIIEYCWVKERSQKLSGALTVQSEAPRSNVSLSIISPLNLQFITKSYNGCYELYEAVDSVKKIRTLLFHADEIPALKKETHSFYNNHLQRVEYGFSYDVANNKINISDILNDDIQAYYNSTHSFDAKEVKALQPLWEKMGIKSNMKEEDKIRIIENDIKTNFQWIDGNLRGKNIFQIPDMLRTKYASTIGYVKLLTASFVHFDIPFELVFTCDRKKRVFDKDFEGNNYWDEIFIYFPSLDAYLDPGSMSNRLGKINTACLGNDGIFLKEIKAGGIGMFTPYYKQIPENDYQKSVHSMQVQLKLNTKDFSAKYSIQHQFLGYTAEFLQPHLYYVNNDRKKNMVKKVIANDFLPDRLLSWKIENQNPVDWYIKPVTIKAELSGKFLISKAGNNIHVRIGALIGKQPEIHQDGDRKLPLESPSNRTYVREITFDIPQGYTLSNPEAIKMKKELQMDGNVEAFFYSDYTISGNKLTVTCTEGYKRTTFAPSLVKEYADVVNAAADFNKIALILVPR